MKFRLMFPNIFFVFPLKCGKCNSCPSKSFPFAVDRLLIQWTRFHDPILGAVRIFAIAPSHQAMKSAEPSTDDFRKVVDFRGK